MYAGNKSYTILVSQIQYVAGQSRKKRRYSTTLITQISFSHTVIQIYANNLPAKQNAILCRNNAYTCSFGHATYEPF